MVMMKQYMEPEAMHPEGTALASAEDGRIRLVFRAGRNGSAYIENGSEVISVPDSARASASAMFDAMEKAYKMVYSRI